MKSDDKKNGKAKVEKKEVVLSGKDVPATVSDSSNEIGRFLDTALNKGLPVETIKELMLLKRDYDDHQNEMEFNRRFADMQSKLPNIKKNKIVYKNDGGVAYKYATLDSILAQVKPVLAENGFSYMWVETKSDFEGYKRISCIVTGWGHSRSSYIDLPVATGTSMNNAVQLEGSRNSYGKRYSFCNATGVVPDDDDDAKTLDNEAPPPKNTPKPNLNPVSKDDKERADVRKKTNELWLEILGNGHEPTEKENDVMEKLSKLNLASLNKIFVGVEKRWKGMGLDKLPTDNDDLNKKK